MVTERTPSVAEDGAENDETVALYGVEAAGHGIGIDNDGEHCAALTKGTPGIFQGVFTYVIQENSGQTKVENTRQRLETLAFCCYVS